MSAPRILEITACGECPHLDRRWEYPPWTCVNGGPEIYTRYLKTIPRDCPLPKQKEYLEQHTSHESND
jgi:hypothetical protein